MSQQSTHRLIVHGWKHLSQILATLLAVVVFTTTSHAQTPVPMTTPIGTQPSTVLAALRQRALMGPVAIMVQLRLPLSFQIESPLMDSVTRDRQRTAIATAQAALIGRLNGLSITAIKPFVTIPYLAAVVDAATLARLQVDPEMVGIEEDGLSAPTLRESIPLIGASAAQAAGYRGAGVTVAVLDTGVDSTHPALNGALVASACFSTTNTPDGATSLCPSGQTSQIGGSAGDACPTSISGCFHGTHVAAIAVGRGSEITGVAPQANLIAVQVFSQFTSAAQCGTSPTPCALAYTSDWIRGLEYVYGLRSNLTIAAANLSLGGGLYTDTCDTVSSAATTIITQLRASAIATVVASGNDGSSTSMAFPACIDSAISVGATTKSDGIASFSNSASHLTLLAPGYAIRSALPHNQYGVASGTSMAAPHVAGAWALMRQRYPNNTVTQTSMALQNTGVPITDPRNGLVRSRIQLDRALQVPPLPTATQTPTTTPTPSMPPTRTTMPATATPPPTTTYMPANTAIAIPTNLAFPSMTAIAMPPVTATATGPHATPIPPATPILSAGNWQIWLPVVVRAASKPAANELQR